MRKSLIFPLFTLLLTGCNSEELFQSSNQICNSGDIPIIDITEDIEMLATNTRIVPSENGVNRYTFLWQPNDQIAIFGDNGLATGWGFFKLKGEGGSTSGEFDGVFKRSNESTYYSFYPALNFTSSSDEKAVPVDYTGQKQISDADFSHLRNFAGAIDTESNNFKSKHVGALVRIELEDPDYSDCSSIELITDGEFVTKGTIDLTTTTLSAAPNITPTETSTIFSIGYSSNGASLSNNTITAYAMIAPASLSGHTLKAYLKHENECHDKEYTLSVGKYSNGSLTSILNAEGQLTQDIQKGVAYKISSVSYETCAPYVTFESSESQIFTPIIGYMFTKDFDDFYCNNIEYSVGYGIWKKLSTAAFITEDINEYDSTKKITIPFGGAKGNLRLRGKCPQGNTTLFDESGNLTALEYSNYKQYIYFGFQNSNPVNCHGDLTTLIDFTNYTSIPANQEVRLDALFIGCTQLLSAPSINVSSMKNWHLGQIYEGCTNLKDVPDFEADEAGYMWQAFANCTNLEKAPQLKATKLSTSCYSSMFLGCSNLKEAPTLPATTLAVGCYSGMFSNCTSLEKAPVLPAETLVTNCYNSMFWACIKLNYVEAMFVSVPSPSPLNGWLHDVSATGTFVKNSNATWDALYDWDSYPSAWTVLQK